MHVVPNHKSSSGCRVHRIHPTLGQRSSPGRIHPHLVMTKIIILSMIYDSQGIRIIRIHSTEQRIISTTTPQLSPDLLGIYHRFSPSNLTWYVMQMHKQHNMYNRTKQYAYHTILLITRKPIAYRNSLRITTAVPRQLTSHTYTISWFISVTCPCKTSQRFRTLYKNPFQNTFNLSLLDRKYSWLPVGSNGEENRLTAVKIRPKQFSRNICQNWFSMSRHKTLCIDAYHVLFSNFRNSFSMCRHIPFPVDTYHPIFPKIQGMCRLIDFCIDT